MEFHQVSAADYGDERPEADENRPLGENPPEPERRNVAHYYLVSLTPSECYLFDFYPYGFLY